MKHPLLQTTGILSLLILFLLTPLAADAQVERGDKTLYVRPHIGTSWYLGDNEQSPFNFDGDIFEDDFPYNVGAEIGWRFSPRYSLGVAYSYGNFNQISDFEANTDVSLPGHEATRWSVSLVGRQLLSDRKIAPYWFGMVSVGGGDVTTFSEACAANVVGACEVETGLLTGGVGAGFGFDVSLSRSMSFFLQTSLDARLPDENVDGRDYNAFTDIEFLGAHTAGLQANLSRFKPVETVSVICPTDEFNTGVPMTFTGSANENATQPVDYRWSFGDGASAQGPTATHTFNRAGEFMVSLTATNGNGKGRASAECPVTVTEPCVEAQITGMRASNMNPDTETDVRFSATVRGSEASSYRWNFGDGSTGTGAMATHRYARAGTYTVTLEVTNCAGTVSRTMTITVNPYEAAICREVTEMNPAFFAHNSSDLSANARAALGENLEILLECPNLNARLEGWAAPGERRAQDLSEDRARAAEQFYVDNGVAASRLVLQPMGRAAGTSKKEGAGQHRRVDTIPLR